MLSSTDIQGVLEGLVRDYHDGDFDLPFREIRVPSMGLAEQVLGECVLSSGWAYSKASAASSEIRLRLPRGDCGRPKDAEGTIKNVLVTSPHKHRFPNSRAQQLAVSLEVIWAHSSNGELDLPNYSDPCELREYLVGALPGIGLKQASMLMRDVGITEKLAIIDRHIIWYLNLAHGFEIESLSRKVYCCAEEFLKNLSANLEIPLSKLDCMIWCMATEYKKQKRASKCEKLSVWPLEDSTHQLAFTY
jgi:thermostable 8-oxoguanine DNA glycosylase